MVYLLPFVIFYEIAVIVTNAESLNDSLSNISSGVVAFVWLQNALHYIGLSGRSALLCTGLVVIIILLALQITSRKQWSVRLRDMPTMGCECIVLTIPLIVFSLLFSRSIQPQSTAYTQASQAVTAKAPFEQNQALPALAGAEVAPEADSDSSHGSFLSRAVAGVGAGIYEELVFRLILICLLMLFFEDILRFSRSHAIVLSVLASAVLFSLHHHIYFLNGEFVPAEAFSLGRFLFRTLAGIYLAALFAMRGFGIAAGTHAFHNIIAAAINAVVFE